MTVKIIQTHFHLPATQFYIIAPSRSQKTDLIGFIFVSRKKEMTVCNIYLDVKLVVNNKVLFGRWKVEIPCIISLIKRTLDTFIRNNTSHLCLSPSVYLSPITSYEFVNIHELKLVIKRSRWKITMFLKSLIIRW